jgi:uncharacterized protein YhbP (UPF0306 family)
METDRIFAFIRRHHVMTLATVGGDGKPWTAHAFYAWMPAGKSFAFMNNPATRHGEEMAANPHIAAAIALETRVVGRLQGLQIEGEVRLAEGDDLESARRAYLRRFPYAAVMEQPLWILEPALMKFTDNTLGFGKKLIWTTDANPDATGQNTDG